MENIVATLVFIVLMAGIVGLVVYKMKKTNPDTTVEEFVEKYYDNLLDVLKDAVRILSVDVANYANRSEYLTAIINLAIEELNNNCEGFGIDTTMFELFNVQQVSQFLSELLERNNIFVFGDTVTEDDANSNPGLYTDVEMKAISAKNDAN